jgi:ABC-2 type transport system permease protein
MKTLSALRWMLWREFLDQRQNRMLWPVYLIMPLVGAALPAIIALATASALAGKAPIDPQMQSMLNAAKLLAAAQGIDVAQAAAVYSLRLAAGYFLLMPVAIVSIAGAYAIVGEKQQRTLEPVLASPISTPQFLLAKMVAVSAPAVIASWIAALMGAIASVASFWWANDVLVWPDVFYWVGVFVLAPEVGAMTALVCLRVSARMQDPQAANQVTALILIPILLIVFSLIGPVLVLKLWALLGACVAGMGIVVALFAWVRRGFNREEILCRWR